MISIYLIILCYKELGFVQTDSVGMYDFILITELADPGWYVMTAELDSNSKASTSFQLDPSAPYRAKEGDYIELAVPGEIAYTNALYLPLVR